ncbi:hypothetical protein PROFUN_07107 [Planoprotostelium fungivorum]|uniref:Homeobox domain-containing protein n=1 Tax=Planoprotostelium fungivorum TaxID=1890364 RepID=A0A2P6NMH3_9EUKA|nr:hypothetical protein PROFUN_07107 [Planoprotostelium fungivorum]
MLGGWSLLRKGSFPWQQRPPLDSNCPLTLTDCQRAHTSYMKIADLIHPTDCDLKSLPPYSIPIECTSSRKKRSKHSNTWEQKQVLEDVYRVTPYPKAEKRKEIAEKLGITHKIVLIWFQNRRNKENKERK